MNIYFLIFLLPPLILIVLGIIMFGKVTQNNVDIKKQNEQIRNWLSLILWITVGVLVFIAICIGAAVVNGMGMMLKNFKSLFIAIFLTGATLITIGSISEANSSLTDDNKNDLYVTLSYTMTNIGVGIFSLILGYEIGLFGYGSTSKKQHLGNVVTKQQNVSKAASKFKGKIAPKNLISASPSGAASKITTTNLISAVKQSAGAGAAQI